jgi:hypothetical protein
MRSLRPLAETGQDLSLEWVLGHVGPRCGWSPCLQRDRSTARRGRPAQRSIPARERERRRRDSSQRSANQVSWRLLQAHHLRNDGPGETRDIRFSSIDPSRSLIVRWFRGRSAQRLEASCKDARPPGPGKKMLTDGYSDFWSVFCPVLAPATARGQAIARASPWDRSCSGTGVVGCAACGEGAPLPVPGQLPGETGESHPTRGGDEHPNRGPPRVRYCGIDAPRSRS